MRKQAQSSHVKKDVLVERKTQPRKLDPKKTLELRERGLSIVDIAEHQKVHPSTVWRFLEKACEQNEKLQRFKANRAEVFAMLQTKHAELQLRILDSLSDEEVESWTKTERKELLKALTMAMGITFDKERLETGNEGNQPITVQIVRQGEDHEQEA